MRTLVAFVIVGLVSLAAGCNQDSPPAPAPAPAPVAKSQKLGFNGIALRTSSATTPIAVGARPTAANQFADISGWRLGGMAPREAILDFDGDAALTISSPTGGSTGPELWGVVNGNIRLLGSLHANPVVIAGDTEGYDEETEDAGLATGLYVAGTVTGGNATVSFIASDSQRGL